MNLSNFFAQTPPAEFGVIIAIAVILVATYFLYRKILETLKSIKSNIDEVDYNGIYKSTSVEAHLEDIKDQMQKVGESVSQKNEDDKGNMGTLITKDLVAKAVAFNGFEPQMLEDGWCSFVYKDHHFMVYCGHLPYISFYNSFSVGQEDSEFEYDVFREAAEIVNNGTVNGVITFDDENNSVTYQVAAIEKSYEHLCLSFMDYLGMLDQNINAHRYAYCKLLDEREKQNPPMPVIDPDHKSLLN